jgi:ribonucleoside-diphosphate reductase alpha chain
MADIATPLTMLGAGLSVQRVFSQEGVRPEDLITWEEREVKLTDFKTGDIVFQQSGVRVPSTWSETATKIMANKYFHGSQKTNAVREYSVEQVVDRVAVTIRNWGFSAGYFATERDANVFRDELKTLLYDQYCAFNSPVWFNVGCDRYEPEARAESWQWDPATGGIIKQGDGYKHPQCSACFINSFKDSMEGIMELAHTEALLFKFGSGTGTNFSTLRSSVEEVSGGGVASGPLSFMRGYDAFAGVIKSGGKTRRAAKMAILNSHHPDIREFILCKGEEEEKAHALMSLGYDGSTPDSPAYSSIFYQNANNSVRVDDEFMQRATGELPDEYGLRAVTTGQVVKKVSAKELLRLIAEQTHKCGDPGMQFDTTINRWHTSKASGRIDASNPCSEYMFLNDSACNLASLNLLKFLLPNGTFDVPSYRAAIRINIIAQEILVDHSGYPRKAIAMNSHDYRPLGLGYANLGALLLQMGLPYDSDEGRDVAAALTAVMGGEAYAVSSELASSAPALEPANPALRDMPGFGVSGAFPGFGPNRESFLEVMRMHLEAARALRPVCSGLEAAAVESWVRALDLGELYGYRNGQTTVLAPTGTIGFIMDCETTGIEPMLGLIIYKKLVGGGGMKIEASKSLLAALARLGYAEPQIAEISAWVSDHGTVEGCKALDPKHLEVFDCALAAKGGKRSISPMGHVKMMAATQPFLSGAISKTVNVPKESTVEDIMQTYVDAWRLGVKAIAIYRDGSKGGQPVSLNKGGDSPVDPTVVDGLKTQIAALTAQVDAVKAAAGKFGWKADSTADPLAHLVSKVEKALAVVSAPDAEAEPLSGPPRANRRRLPEERASLTHHFKVGQHEGYITVGLYENGTPGEVFIKMAKEGSTVSGLMDTIATSVSLGLQHGVPLKVFCTKFAHMRFEPSGWTGNEEMGFATSLMDYIFRWLEMRFLKGQQLSMFNFGSPAPSIVPSVVEPEAAKEHVSITDLLDFGDAPSCGFCGSIMMRNGSCHKCPSCGGTSGCS